VGRGRVAGQARAFLLTPCEEAGLASAPVRLALCPVHHDAGRRVHVRLPVPGSRHPADRCCFLAQPLAADPRYRLIYAGPGAQVYARR
jgi:hypothetical protein